MKNKLNKFLCVGFASVVMFANGFGGASAQEPAPPTSVSVVTAVTKTATVGASSTQRMSAPTLHSVQSGTWKKGTKLTLTCHARGQRVSGYYSSWVPGGTSNIWYKTTEKMWVADIDINTGSNDPVVAACSSIKWGATRSSNTGVAGNCTWGAYSKFKAYTTTYPALTGNAKDWFASAKNTGWSTTTTPRANSIVVFQPRVHGAHATYGHVGWVTGVTKTSTGVYRVTFTEMNGVGGFNKWSTRTVNHVSGMGYILAPPR